MPRKLQNIQKQKKRMKSDKSVLAANTPPAVNLISAKQRAFTIAKTLAFQFILLVVCGYVLLQFLKPSQQHIGINQYESALFLDMVEGSAYKPYVHRRLVPGLVDILTGLVSESTRLEFSHVVVKSANLRLIFSVFNWEPQAAFQYAVATLAMLISLYGFGYCGAHFTFITCCLVDRRGYFRCLLSIIHVLCLIPFFKYASYIYDPTHLFLFTLALLGLAQPNRWAFAIGFGLGCLNKETAVLLIPLALWTYHRTISRGRFVILAIAMMSTFVLIKGLLIILYQSNPGNVVEWHVWDHNLIWFKQSMGYGHVIFAMVLWGLLIYRWKEKSLLLRRALLCTAPPLISLTLLFGYVDEWRDYYEVYPIGFALIVDSMQRFRNSIVLKWQRI